LYSLHSGPPGDRMLRAIDHFVDLAGLRQHLASFYSVTGRPSIDPELMIRMKPRSLYVIFLVTKDIRVNDGNRI
jgi:transposase